MKSKITLAFLSVIAIASMFVPSVSSAYTADYTVSDMDDIMIDLTGTAMVSVKGQVPTLVDLGVLYLIFALILAVIGIAIAVFLVVPKKVKGGFAKTKV